MEPIVPKIYRFYLFLFSFEPQIRERTTISWILTHALQMKGSKKLSAFSNDHIHPDLGFQNNIILCFH
jgi:hypothetical protein